MKRKSYLLILLPALMFVSCSKPSRQEAEMPDKILKLEELKAKIPFEGKIVFQSDMDGDNEIYILTSRGLEKLTDNTWSDEYPKWSPDGKKIAFTSNQTGNYDIYVMEVEEKRVAQVTAGPRNEVEEAWFPDGRRIAYTEEVKRAFGKSYSLCVIDLVTKEKKRIIPDFPGSNALPDFSPIEPLMAFTGKKMIGWDVYIFNMEQNEYRNLTENAKTCRPDFSRDGKKIAYVSHEADGKGDIWVMNPDGGEKQRVTMRDDSYDYFPAWSPDGKFIAFCSNFKSMYAEKGDWTIYLVDTQTKRVIPFFDSPGRDVFPDWY